MRKVMILLLLALLAMTISGAAAQDATVPVVCGELSDADCTLLTNAQVAMFGVESGNISLSLDLVVDGLGTPTPVTLLIAGVGSFSGDLSALYSTSVSPTDLMLDASRYSDYIQQMFSSFNGQLDLAITLPADLINALMMGAEGAPEIPSSLTLNLLLVDGVGYLNVDPLAALLGEDAAAMGLPAGWAGIDLAGAMAMSVEQALDMDALLDPDAMAELSDPNFINQFASVTRIEDGAASDGAATARFQTTINYVDLMSSEAMQQIMIQSMQTQGQEMSAEEVEMITGMLSGMYQGMSLVSVVSVGLNDGLLRAQEMTLNWDLSAVMGMAGAPSDGTEVPMLNLVIGYELSNFNSGITISAPADAPVVSAEELMGMGMGQ